MSGSGLSWRAQPAAGPLNGELRVPSDKSITHRSVMLGGVARGTTVIHQPLLGEDARATMAAMEKLGAKVEEDGDCLRVTGTGELSSPEEKIDCGNAGTLIRLLAGLICGRNVDCELDGDESLRRRPMRRITDPLRSMGAMIDASPDGTPPLLIGAVGELTRIEYTLPIASAQIKSAILLAGLRSPDGACVIEPQPCRDHTELILPEFGAQLRREGGRIEVGHSPELAAAEISVPADISSAAFFLVAASIVPGSDLLLRDVGINPTRCGIIELLRRMGAAIDLVDERSFGKERVADLRVRHAKLKGIEIGAADIPAAIDELPVLMIAAARAEGRTSLREAEELRAKESDRLATMAAVLAALGVEHDERADGIDIVGSENEFQGGCIDSLGDHRIAMAGCAAALMARDEIEVGDVANVATSFPGFVEMASDCGWRID